MGMPQTPAGDGTRCGPRSTALTTSVHLSSPQRNIQFASTLRTRCVRRDSRYCAHANHNRHVAIPQPSKPVWPGPKPCVPHGLQLRPLINALSWVLSFKRSFQPLSLSSTVSANKPAPGGAAVFCFARAPLWVLVPPTSRAPSKKADLGTWELPHTRALRVVCLERLRALKELFRCTYMLSGIALGCGPLADVSVIRARVVFPWPLPERRPATP